MVSKKKLIRLSFVFVCIICIYAVYMVYLFHSQNRDFTHIFDTVEDFELYSSGYLRNGEGSKQSQKSVRFSDTHQKGARDDSDETKYWQSLENDVKDDHFVQEYTASLVPIMKDQSPQNQAYMDADLSNNFMDIHDMHNVDVNSADVLASRATDATKNQQDFHYPEIGYHYYGVVKGSQDIPSHKFTSPQQIYKNNINQSISSVMARGGNVSKIIVPIQNVTKSKKVQSNVRTTKRKKRPFSNILPPPPTDTVSKRPEDVRYLVYLCDSLSLCGGWGDRQRGMVSTYLLSRLVDRQLKIIMTTPCNLRFFYKPNRVQWLPVSNELVTGSNITVNALTNKSFQLNIMEGDFNVKFPQKVVYLKTNQDYYNRLIKNTFYSQILDQWGGLYSRRSRFHWGWSDLMQPSHLLLNHLQHIVGAQFLVRKGLIASSVSDNKRTNSTTSIENSTLICAHVRMGKNPTIPMDENLNNFKLDQLPTLFKFMLSKDIKGDARFFVATDYDYIRSESKQFFGHKVVDYGGKILHIDRQRSEHSACVGFEVALMDQLILSLCDILVVCKSGFSIQASFMSNNTEQVYLMENGVIDLFNG